VIPLTLDLSIFNKFNFERHPVGVKFLFDKPEGIERLDKTVAFCGMVNEAQQRGTPFYTDLKNHLCIPGTYTLGYDMPKVIEGGYLGTAMQLYKEAYANRRIYETLLRFEKDTVNYIVFSPVDKMTFNPDLLIILTDNVSQTEILLRASSYTNGKIYNSKQSGGLGCSWLYAYPYLTGELNYLTTGLGFGMKAMKAFPEGHQVISVPCDLLPTIISSLQEMPWVPTSFSDETGEYDKQLFKEFGIPFPE